MSMCGKPNCKEAKTCPVRRLESTRQASRRARHLATALIGYALVLAGLMGIAIGAAIWLAMH